MHVYTVTREGVYRHETMGCYASEIEARERAVQCVLNDDDAYHAYAVNRLTVGADDEITVDTAQGVSETGEKYTGGRKPVGVVWMAATS